MPDLQTFPSEINRILFVRNLPFKITNTQLFEIFGKYGYVRQIRIGNAKETRGTAYVVYDQLQDAKNACEHLSGYCVSGRYLVVLYWQSARVGRKVEVQKKQKELEQIKAEILAAKSK